MIPQIWDKRVPCIIELFPQDAADLFPPLPLILEFSWNHYIGMYYSTVKSFFRSCFPYPTSQSQFWMELANGKKLNGAEIISHLFIVLQLQLPIRMYCHFRSKCSEPQIDLKRHFKSNLKSSTALRNGKNGAKIITVEMSVGDVDDMFFNFKNNQYSKYLGWENELQKHLGYQFIIEQTIHTKIIPLRIIHQQNVLQRGVARQTTLRYFLSSLINTQTKQYHLFQTKQKIIQKQIEEFFVLRIHGIKIRSFNLSFQFFDKFCHPDGFLYLTLQSLAQRKLQQ